MSNLRAIWLAIILLTATIIAAASGWLAHAGGAPLPTAILTAGGAFASVVALLLAVASYATNKPERDNPSK